MLRSFVTRALTLVIAGLGLFWGASNIERSAVSSDFSSIEARLLRFEIFSRTAATKILENSAAQELSACDNHAQRTLLLLEIPLAEVALRSGATGEFDQHTRSLQDRTRQVLSCTPRDSFAWLVAFGLETLHGRLDDHSFNLLTMSFETSPNEAWIAVRRITVAVPLALFAPERIRKQILDEFQDLVRNKFLEIPARSYLTAPAPVRALLQSRIEELDLASQKAFSEALLRLRP